MSIGFSGLKAGAEPPGIHEPARPKALLWFGLLSIVVLAGSWVFIDFFAGFAEGLERNALTVAASTAAASFDAHEIATLKATAADRNGAAFRHAREALQRVRTAIPTARFAYLMTRRGGKIVFLADAEPENSSDYSPPGQPYANASRTLIGIFTTKTPATEGPLADPWGVWVSGLAPVVDRRTGAVVAVVGVDISASHWQTAIAAYRQIGLAISGGLSAFILFFGFLVYRQQRLGEKLAVANRIVEDSTAILYRLAATPSMPLTFVSSNVRRLGHDAAEFIAMPLLYRTLVHPEDEAIVEEFLQRAGSEDEVESVQFRIRAKDGSYVWVEGRIRAQRSRSGRLLAFEGMLVDITDAKLAEEKLQFAHTLLRTEMENSPDGILAVDENGRIISFNQHFRTMWGVQIDIHEMADDAPVLKNATATMKNPRAFLARVRELYAHPDDTGHDELETLDGRFIERHTAPLRGEAGQYLGRVWFFRDITVRKQAEAKIIQLAQYDTLTGLANRRVFMETVNRAIERAGRGGKGFAVLYLDLDHFKDINDTLGHPAGDDLLCAVAERLRQSARATDLIARFGGDEFAVIADSIDDPADAVNTAERLISAVGKPFCINGNDIRCGVSIGISVYEAGDSDAEKLLSHADVALYREKAGSRGGYQFFTDEMDTEVRSRVKLIAELRDAIAAEQFFVEYQPQIDVDSGCMIGMEALVRWHHPTRGDLPPSAFVTAAEKSGLIVDIEHWVMREACHQAKRWSDDGIAPLTISVNVSGVRFKAARNLERDIESILESLDLPPQWLGLELTESVLMEASREHGDVIARLRQRGIKLSIDDFGTGYSSLDYLRRFPMARVKMAQDFVRHITTDPGSAAIVRATIGLARELGMAVIAEGVETDEQIKLLKDWGCHEVQGYYFSKPLNPADVLAMVRRCSAPQPKPDAERSAA